MEQCDTFRALHAEGIFVMPNPWDVGSAKRLAALGFPALATTSSGFAWSIGKEDQQITFEELLPHVEALVAAVDVPLNVDAERCYAADPAGVARTVAPARPGRRGRLLDRGLRPGRHRRRSTRSTSPWHGWPRPPRPPARAGVVLTARAENHLYGPTTSTTRSPGSRLRRGRRRGPLRAGTGGPRPDRRRRARRRAAGQRAQAPDGAGRRRARRRRGAAGVHRWRAGPRRVLGDASGRHGAARRAALLTARQPRPRRRAASTRRRRSSSPSSRLISSSCSSAKRTAT